MRILLSLAVAATLSACASAPRAPEPATCPSQAEVDALFVKYAALEPAPNPPATMTVEGGLCGRDKLVAKMGARYGKVVGYKAGLTNAAVQKRFNYPAPVRGTLFESMIVRDGAEVPAKFGSRPLYEADLVVVVKDAGIHDAKTPMEVLMHLTAIHPFLELPDLVVEDPSKIGGGALNFINVGARMGVLGAAIPAKSDLALYEALRDMTVRLTDGTGKELDAGKGSAILEHPLNAVIWLAGDLKKAGITLKPGDLLSLGSFSKLLPPQPGLTVRATYEGLPGNPSVSVRFR